VAARYLSEAGANVACYLLKPRDGEDANFAAVRERELFVADATTDQRLRVLHQLVTSADVIIDALLGTGVHLPLEGSVAVMLERVSAGLKTRRSESASARKLTGLNDPAKAKAPALIVAVDGPSGLDCDSGDIDPQALAADVTVTFARPKWGHFLFPGAGACGDLVVADIGIDERLLRKIVDEATVEIVTPAMIAPLLPTRSRDAHKGTFGKALVVAGSINYTGAAFLAASGAARVGAGLVTLAVPAAIHGPLAAKISEATFLILPQAMGIVAPNACSLLLETMGTYQAMLLGPGLTQEKEVVEFVDQLFQSAVHPTRTSRIGFQVGTAPEGTPKPSGEPRFPPLVVDADGLNALAALHDAEWWRRLPPNTVLTPHPGEMARLMGGTAAEVQGDRLGVAKEMAVQWGHVVLLKGAFTVVAAPDGRAIILPFATPALATAGSGDVLAGAIVGLLAQGLAPFDAAVVGAYVHGLAGQWANREIGPSGSVAGDLLPRLPRALRFLGTAR
jgi:NAD(P)H-hydrate repair Nnr-like enzyme with NAD(P)H-hydrate dehydratase domain/NAD(P)H-hydrate repair Nnr-like enzyme with NAD(P)H-hydrate epimerase domain